MHDLQNNFSDIETLNTHLQDKGFILVTYRNCKDYPGMVLSILLRFEKKQATYQLALEWESLGLDLYGDTLQESYAYQFENLEALLEYLLIKYEIKITDIPVKYSFDGSQFPNPIYYTEQRPEFEAAWQRFQEDFKKGAFLDPSLMLVYSS